MPVSALLARSCSVPVLVPAFRVGARFWIFDITHRKLQPSLPIPLAGGISGASGGAAEVLLHSLVVQRTLPSFHAVASHSGRLFLGFGTFTGLSSYLSEEFPPRPFPLCWLLGAVAGAVGSGIGELLERRGNVSLRHWGRTTGTGAAVIATAIAVQVTSCAEVFKWVEASKS